MLGGEWKKKIEKTSLNNSGTNIKLRKCKNANKIIIKKQNNQNFQLKK